MGAGATVQVDGRQHYTVQARAALLNKQFKKAEAILLDQACSRIPPNPIQSNLWLLC